MDRHGWTASAIGALALLCALLLVAGIAVAQPMRVADELAVEVQAERVASALVRPADPQLLVIQLTSDKSRITPALGIRWWLAQRRASFELMVRRSLDSQRVEPQIGVQVAFGD
jgi:hypothetical protein